jgi:hypothetical protein
MAAAVQEPGGATDVATILVGPLDDLDVTGRILHFFDSSIAVFTARI